MGRPKWPKLWILKNSKCYALESKLRKPFEALETRKKDLKGKYVQNVFVVLNSEDQCSLGGPY